MIIISPSGGDYYESACLTHEISPFFLNFGVQFSSGR